MYINNLITGTMTLGSGGSTPTIDPAKTRFTLEGGTVEEYNIVGTLDQNWLDAHGLWTWAGMVWEKNIISIEIGSTVTSIGEGAFSGCNGLTSITIGNDVTSIGDYAFNSCIGLTNVTIPNNMMNIGFSTFQYCSGLTSVTFEGKDKATVQRMSNYPFGLDYANINGVTIHCTDDDIQVSFDG